MFTNLIFIVSLLILLFFGFFVFRRGPQNRTRTMFFLVCMSFSVWMFFNFLVDYTSNISLAKIFVHFDFAFASVFSYLFLLFCQVFPNKGFKSLKKIILLAVLPFIFFILSLFTNLIVVGLNQSVSGFEVIYGLLEIPYDLFIVGYILTGGIYLVFRFKKTSGVERYQILYALLGLSFLTSIAIVANLVLPYVFPDTPTITRVGYAGVAIWGIFTAYAITKYHLFDIRVILTETATAIVVLALFVQTLLSKTWLSGLINGIVLALVTYGGYLLIKSVKQEIKRREQLQKLTEQLEIANIHLKELDAMKTEFVSLASHELLTPVSAIEGYLSMIIDEKMARIDDPKAQKYLDRIYSAAKRLARLVTDMLNVSRIEEGRLLVEKQDVHLTELVHQVIDELRIKAEESKQKIIFENPNHWDTFGDADKIREILINLIGNGIKYSKNPGTITLRVEKVPTSSVEEVWKIIEKAIRARPLDDQEAVKSAVDERMKRLVGSYQILVSVKDQGIGIPAEELPRLFKKFHRVGDYTRAESQGSGLGLYISRALVELHHGRIWAKSEGRSKGSTFLFSLPELSVKEEIKKIEAQVPRKADMKPLARPAKEAEEI